MVIINGDLIPFASGLGHLGVDGSVGDATGGFDISTLAPFGHIHMLSGVWHDPMQGQSGVMRFNLAMQRFEVSVDGGSSFQGLTTAGSAVSSVGVLGGADLTGDVDLSPATGSGFIVIGDTGGTSPITFAVDQLSLSGLWDFPTQGFNGRVVNALTDDNGTEAQGIINVAGASGVTVDIIGQTLIIAPAGSGIARSYAQDFNGKNITITHNLNTINVIVQAVDDKSPPKVLIPHNIEIVDVNVINLRFNGNQTGRVVVLGG